MYAIKQAILLSGSLPIADITIYYMDIRAFGKGYEQFFQNAKAMGIEPEADEPEAPRLTIEDRQARLKALTALLDYPKPTLTIAKPSLIDFKARRERKALIEALNFHLFCENPTVRLSTTGKVEALRLLSILQDTKRP